MPKVSVIIPVYNGAEYLNSCIECLSKQSLKDIEIIFIDDGSTDNTLFLLRSWCSSNIVVLSQKNAGAGVARNNGLSHAKGEYVAFLDVDFFFVGVGSFFFVDVVDICLFSAFTVSL